MSDPDTSALRALQEAAELRALPVGSVILDIGVIDAPVICCKAADGLWHVTGTPRDRRWNHFEIIRDSVEQGNRLIVAYDPSRDPDLIAKTEAYDQLREALFDIQERIEHTVNTKTQDGVGYVIDHWRGQDFVDGRDSGIEMIAGQVSSIIQALAIPAGPKAGE